MLLSIIIPYYNSDSWIAGMLDSLLDQDIPKDQYEIIVVDDGSSEYPVTLLKYADCHSNIYYYKLNHKGPSGARNLGVQKAKGEWIYFCDSDDYVQTNVLGSLIAKGVENKAEIVYCDYTVVMPSNTPCNSLPIIKTVSDPMSGLSFIVDYSSHISFGVWSYLIRRDLFIRNHLCFRDMIYVEDRMFALDWIPVVQSIIYVDVVLYYYVQRETSILHSKKRNNYDFYANSLVIFQDKLEELVGNTAFPEKPRQVFKDWLDDSSFFLLTNLFRYSSIRTMKRHIEHLIQIGAYPVRVIGKFPINLIRKVMNHKGLWLFASGIYHLLPKQIRILL